MAGALKPVEVTEVQGFGVGSFLILEEDLLHMGVSLNPQTASSEGFYRAILGRARGPKIDSVCALFQGTATETLLSTATATPLTSMAMESLLLTLMAMATGRLLATKAGTLSGDLEGQQPWCCGLRCLGVWGFFALFGGRSPARSLREPKSDAYNVLQHLTRSVRPASPLPPPHLHLP